MEGDGSRVTFLACSWVPREDEEPGKETEKVGPPPPLPQALGTRRAASCTDNSSVPRLGMA